MKLIPISFFFLLAISLFSCNGGAGNNTETPTDSTAVTNTEPAPTDNTAELFCNDLGVDEHENPRNEVVFKLGGKEYKIDTILACAEIPKEDYARHEIPATAITACGGWWAGGGDYFYLIVENNQPVVYQGWQDEGQEDVGFHWAKMNLNLK